MEAFKECGVFGDLQESWYDRMGFGDKSDKFNRNYFKNDLE